MSDINDEYNLNRFVVAQIYSYKLAISELKNGQKRSHWMWYIFSQFDGLSFSSTSKIYSIKSISKAKAYLDHPVIGLRLIECVNAVLCVEGRTAHEIFGSPDDNKLKSCSTLFASILPSGSIFERLLDKYYQGKRDLSTINNI